VAVMPDSPSVTVLDAAFVAEARDALQMPSGGPPEIAIAGRSNVGKSTLLNRMAGRHGLARVSKTPGRTRGLVVFDLRLRVAGQQDAECVRLVDLPGYGYAKVPQDERRAWQTMVEGYLKDRPTLVLALVLVDARRGLADEEMQVLEWLRGVQVPCYLVVTKSDKLGASERGLLRQRVRKEAAAMATSVFLVSGETGEGVDGLWSSIAHVIKNRKGDGAAWSG
jgi:GTP-binding protein